MILILVAAAAQASAPVFPMIAVPKTAEPRQERDHSPDATGMTVRRAAQVEAIGRIAPRPQSREACRLLRSPAGTQLIAVGHYEGAALSSAWIGSPNEEAHVVDLYIAPGPPLHLVVSAYGRTVYRVAGKTARLKRMTLMNRYGAAVSGLAKARLEFAGRCVDYSQVYRGRSLAHEKLAELFGKTPTALGGAYELWRARIGSTISAQVAPRRDAADPALNELLRFSPGGLAWVDPNQLVSDRALGAYEVLPQQAGTLQLLREGAIRRATEADARSWEAAARKRGQADARAPYGYAYGQFRVLRPIAVPAGLCGAHSVDFYAPDESYVRGDLCHSTIYFDDGSGEGVKLR